jgi:hypothetical protein
MGLESVTDALLYEHRGRKSPATKPPMTTATRKLTAPQIKALQGVATGQIPSRAGMVLNRLENMGLVETRQEHYVTHPSWSSYITVLTEAGRAALG